MTDPKDSFATIHSQDGQIEIIIKCSRRVFITVLVFAAALLGGPDLLAALQQAAALLGQ
jgi:hypothetical protein